PGPEDRADAGGQEFRPHPAQRQLQRQGEGRHHRGQLHRPAEQGGRAEGVHPRQRPGEHLVQHPRLDEGLRPRLRQPYYAITDNDGNFEIPKPPAGNYYLVVWHEEGGWHDVEEMKASSGKTVRLMGQKITIKPDADTKVDLTYPTEK